MDGWIMVYKVYTGKKPIFITESVVRIIQNNLILFIHLYMNVAKGCALKFVYNAHFAVFYVIQLRHLKKIKHVKKLNFISL